MEELRTEVLGCRQLVGSEKHPFVGARICSPLETGDELHERLSSWTRGLSNVHQGKLLRQYKLCPMHSYTSR